MLCRAPTDTRNVVVVVLVIRVVVVVMAVEGGTGGWGGGGVSDSKGAVLWPCFLFIVSPSHERECIKEPRRRRSEGSVGRS